MLTEKLKVFLGCISSFIDVFRAFGSSSRELLGFIFDFGMESFKEWKYGAFDALLSLKVSVRDGLSISPNVLEKARNAAQALIEMMPFLQGVRYGLRDVSVAQTSFIALSRD